MPFEPGNQYAKDNRNIRVIDQAIRKIIAQDQWEADQKKAKSRLHRAIEKQLDNAADGNLDSLDWITCRLEGKANAIVQTDSTLAITVDINRPKLTPAQWLQTHGIVNEIKDLECVEQGKECLLQPTPVEGGITPLSLVGASSQSHHLEIVQNQPPEIVQNHPMQDPPHQVVMDENSV
jgi:hypothetical protein